MPAEDKPRIKKCRQYGCNLDIEVPIDIGSGKFVKFDLATTERDVVAERKAFAFVRPRVVEPVEKPEGLKYFNTGSCAYEADSAPAADTPARPFVPLIYRALMYRDGLKHEPDDVIDLNTGERVGLPAAEVPCALPAPTPSAAPMETSQPKKEFEIDILDL